MEKEAKDDGGVVIDKPSGSSDNGGKIRYESMHQDDVRARPWRTPTEYNLSVKAEKPIRYFNYFIVKEKEEKVDDSFVVIDKPAASCENGGKTNKPKNPKK